MNYFLTFFRIENIQYVMNAPYFWQAMAATTICSMFIGATLHNGDFDSVKKVSISLGSYILMLLITTIARVFPIYEQVNSIKTYEQLAQIYANPMTILFLSFFWFIGLFWGVYLVNRTRKNI